MKPTPQPPRWAVRLLTWLHPPETLEEVQGDLLELFTYWHRRAGARQARIRYAWNVLSVLPPLVRRRHPKTRFSQPSLFHPDMVPNYLKIAWRNLVRHKTDSFINVGGLAVGMAVAVLNGLWVWDELSFNTHHQNYDRIAQVKQHQTANGTVGTLTTVPYTLGNGLSDGYGSDFKYVVMATSIRSRILTYGDKTLSKTGIYIGSQAPDMLTLKMRQGTRAGLEDLHSILLAESVARAFFGRADPMGKRIRIDNQHDLKVSGVYEDLPHNSSFRDASFMVPFDLFIRSEKWVREMTEPWSSNSFGAFVQLADNADMDHVSAKIKNIRFDKLPKEKARMDKPEVFLHPMAKWHLYAEFKNGENTGGQIEFVWLFAIIGGFVLLLACINFMNLSTARSSTRAREVGVRKVVGSARAQLVGQFLGESLLLATVAFGLCLVLVRFTLPFFNQLANKQMAILWANPWFWLAGTGFCLLTGLVAGSYPALYLSSFQPIKVLKGTFRAGRLAVIPRKVLVVVQFTISIILIIGTIVVFRQIEFARNRPAGYNRAGLLMLPMTTKAIHAHFEAFRDELKKSGAVVEVAESNSPLTQAWSGTEDLTWTGKDPNAAISFSTTGVTQEYAQTVGWQFREGRGFSKEIRSDYEALVVNEAAVKLMGFQDSKLGGPVGQTVKWGDKDYRIVGVIGNVIVESPYAPVKPAVFYLSSQAYADAYLMHFFFVKINPTASVHEALDKIETTFKKFSSAAPFDYQFVDEEYAKKFYDEERIGKLAQVFAILAIFLSGLGIFGLASFVAEQRKKEIGVRKVLGATTFNLWRLLSEDFVRLVVIAVLIATPVAHYFLSGWLRNYEYRTQISGWIFAATGAGALVITLLTVSYQAIKAALANPVKSLRTE